MPMPSIYAEEVGTDGGSLREAPQLINSRFLILIGDNYPLKRAHNIQPKSGLHVRLIETWEYCMGIVGSETGVDVSLLVKGLILPKNKQTVTCIIID